MIILRIISFYGIKFNFLRFLIYVRALYCLLKLTYLAHVPKKLLEELPGFNPVEEALEEIEATELCVRKFTEVKFVIQCFQVGIILGLLILFRSCVRLLK